MGGAHDFVYPQFSSVCATPANLVRFFPQLYFLSPTICLTDAAVRFNQSSSSFSYLNTSLDQHLARGSSQPRPRAPASSPLPLLRSTQPHAVNNLQHSTSRNRTLVPVYVYPEHLATVCQFLLALGQPLVLDPAENGDFPPEPEVDVLASPLSEFQGAGGLDGGYAPNESEHALTSSMSRLSLASSYIPSTPGAASSTRRSHLFSSSYGSPTRAARHSPLPINTVPPLSQQTSPSKNKYYSVTIGKKTGVFWDEW